ncbi:MAG: hypothetical protein DRJ46_03525 [Thermoprotei archaeon]|nr:MAG: hypothetical protein DRJ46_03525 [Thermoprotei archaeon]
MELGTSQLPAGLGHRVVSGGARSCAERFTCTVKDRVRGFDSHFPPPRRLLASALKLLYA